MRRSMGERINTGERSVAKAEAEAGPEAFVDTGVHPSRYASSTLIAEFGEFVSRVLFVRDLLESPEIASEDDVFEECVDDVS